MNDWGLIVSKLKQHYGSYPKLAERTGISKRVLRHLGNDDVSEPKHAMGEDILHLYRKVFPEN